MLKARSPAVYSNNRLWNRMRVQMAGGLFFSVLLPMAVLAMVYQNFLSLPSTHWAGAGVATASLLSVYLLRNISLFPGIRSAFFVFPVVLTAYTGTFLLFLLLRLDYSRVVLISAGTVMLVWLYFVQLMIDRGPALRIGVVPGGEVEALAAVPSLELSWLDQPRLGGDYELLVADFRADLPDRWETFLADCALSGMPVLHVKQLLEAMTGRVQLEHLSENSFGSLVPFMVYLRLRRAIDFLTALTAAVLLLPVFVICAIVIKLDSPGPALFRQVRIGYRGKPFTVFKFRTMVVHDSPDPFDAAMTKENDSRVTRVGRVLRRTRLDELPQIINILRGEMSWIGPRPEAEPLSRWYESELPFYRYRHIVPPGITGWAQVNQGHVFELDQVMSKLQYDFYYIKNFSASLDALIVAKTVQTIFSGFGSK
jgi:lipopolysaccharide/colanic/teichoic acid biosynthesis glycosyltransferase